MFCIKKYGKYILVLTIPIVIPILNYLVKAIFNVGVVAGTYVRILSDLF